MINISSTLFSPTDKLKIQISVSLNNNEYNNIVNTFETERGVYISINPNIVVVIKYCPPNKQWEKTDNIYINTSNIYPLRSGLISFYKKIMREDMFIYNTKGYVAEINSSEHMDDDVEIIPLFKGQFLRLEPSIIYDKQGNSLPGVMMRINTESNEVDLSMEEYEAMMNIFNSINIRQEGMMIFQTYLMMMKRGSGDTPQNLPPQTKPKTNNTKRSMYDRQPQEFVKAPVEHKNEFMDLSVNEM